MNVKTLFSEQDRQRLAEAVKAAERSTSGEIVPYIVGHSDTYPEALWRAGSLVGLLILCVFSVLYLATDVWLPYGVAEVAAFVIAGCGLAILALALVPSLKMLFVPSSMLTQRVEERASMAFLAEEVFKTRERTGIMVFVSLLERRVRVMGDSGINTHVAQEEWDDVVRTIVAGMKAGRPADALVDAIGKCGALLEKRGVQIRPDDTDELDNALRIHEQ
jgi:putative membrane protein